MLLLVDAVLNLILGVLLLLFPRALVNWLGIPQAASAFYPTLLGAVLFGIGIALLIERGRARSGLSGLGLAGAVSINLSGAIVLAAWLILGRLGLTARGFVVLWVLVSLLVGVSLLEVQAFLRGGKGEKAG